MLFLLALILASALTLSCARAIEKHPWVFCAAALVLTLVCCFVPFTGLPLWVQTGVLDLFRRGVLAAALWVIVAFTGALPAASPLRKRWLPIRGQLSILAAIMSLGHSALFAHSAARISPAAAVTSVLLLVLMLPLTVLSFPRVRRRMDAGRWKKLQRAAYLFYGLLFVHILLVLVPMARQGDFRCQVDVCIYSLVFLSYFIARIQKALNRRFPGPGLKVTGAVLLLAAMAAVLLLVQAPKAESAPTEPTIPATSAPAPSEPTETAAPTVPETTVSETTVPETTVPETTVPETAVTESPDDPGIYYDGVYTGYGYGYISDAGEQEVITAVVTIVGDEIVSIETTSSNGDNWFFFQARVGVVTEVLYTQDTEFDTSGGATSSSNGLIEAIEDALYQARVW